MFAKKSSRTEQVTSQAKDAGTKVRDQLRDNVAPAAVHAAEQTRDWAAPRVVATKEWAAPRVVAAKDWAAPRAQKGLDAAAPRVEHAVDAVTPKIDAARDKLVDDVLPKLVDAINAATSQAAQAKDEAVDRAQGTWAVTTGQAVAVPKKKRHRIRTLLLLGSVAAAGAAAFKSLRGKRDDPWATDTTPSWASSGATSATTSAATPAAAVPSEASQAEAVAEAAEAMSDDTIDVTKVEGDLGSGEVQADAPDGDHPGKIEPSAASRRNKPRDDG